jgi:hypothetical protein
MLAKALTNGNGKHGQDGLSLKRKRFYKHYPRPFATFKRAKAV